MFSFSAFESKYFYFNFGSKWSNYSSELNYLGEVFKGKLLSIELRFNEIKICILIYIFRLVRMNILNIL
jgi:hypothetical protein